MNWKCTICGSDKVARRQAMHSRFPAFRKRKLVTCGECSAKTVFPIPNETELAEINRTYWESTGTDSASARKGLLELSKHRVNYLVSQCGSLDAKRILDIGAGHAYPYDAIRLLGCNTDYAAVESDEHMRDELSAKGITAYADLTDVSGKHFDLIILSHVVEHVQSPVEFLKQASDCLSEDGLLFIEVPNQDDQFKLDLGLHLAVYNPSAIATLCHSAGLLPSEVSTAGAAIDELRPTLVGRLENQLRHTNTLAYRIWRRARKSFLPADRTANMNAPLSRTDHRGRWLRVVAKKRLPSVLN